MVYTKLWIILGVKISYDDLRKYFIDADELEDFRYDDETLDPKLGIKLYQPGCCSESKECILGFIVHTYYRKVTRCENCPTYCVCDTCIGMTNNGHYDVQKIRNEVVEVNLRHVCFNCYHDNKKDLGGLHESRLTNPSTVAQKFIGQMGSEGEKCQVCNRVNNNNCRTPAELLEWQDHRCEIIRRWIEEKMNLPKGSGQKPKLYYKLNDCSSCT